MTRVETFGRLSLWLSASGGVAAGLAIVWLAEMPVRWVTAVLLGAGIVAAALMTGQPRRAALFLTAFSLQIGLVLYLTKPEPASDLGASWPNSLALPLGTLAALGALLCGVRRNRRVHHGRIPAGFSAPFHRRLPRCACIRILRDLLGGC